MSSLEAQLARAIEALGGPAWEAATRWSLYGRVETLGGLRGPCRAAFAAPDRFAIEWDVAGAPFAAGHDGERTWDRQGSVRLLDRDEAGRLRRLVCLDPIRRHLVMAAAAGGVERLADGRVAVSVEPPGGPAEVLLLDGATGLPVARGWTESLNEGECLIAARYGGWRRVGAVLLPHEITVEGPELDFSLAVDEYRFDEPGPSLEPPGGAGGAEPYEIVLASIPKRLFAEPDDPAGGIWIRHWGIPTPPHETWLLNVVVTERFGRPVEPVSASIGLWQGRDRVKSIELGAGALRAARRFPVARFHPPPERFHLRHWFTEPCELAADRLEYVLRLRAPDGSALEAALTAPIERRVPSTGLSFPLRGRFVVVVGHDRSERSHVYERSQRFALDAIPLDERGALGGDPARGTVVRAPAAGRVVHARDDVPDEMPPSRYLALSDPLTAIGGNGVVIDHENGEFSVLFHLRRGSVRVAVGDRVRRGEPLGMVGSAGSPGYPHLHYHLQDGPDFLAADGLPARFNDVVVARSVLDPYRAGFPIPLPGRGLVLETGLSSEVP